MRVILASASPRRSEYLRGLGLDLVVMPSNIDEVTSETEPSMAAMQLAKCKATAVADICAASGVTGDVVIAADTNVVIDGVVLGKPVDREDAVRMLTMLSGRDHEVITGVCVIRMSDAKMVSAVEQTRVAFAAMSPEVIDSYVDTGEPMDKAGAYGIQGRAGAYVSSIDGCFYNVAGIPLSRLRGMLEDLGFSVWKVW